MATKVTPNSWASKKAYIADGNDAGAKLVEFGGGQHVQIVDDRADADMVIRVKGMSALEARAAARRAVSGDRMQTNDGHRPWFKQYAIFSAVLWIVIAIGAGSQQGVGAVLVLLLLTPLVAVLWAPMLRFFKRMILG